MKNAFLYFCCLSFFVSSFLMAKAVKVDWDAVPGASSYELLIEIEGKAAVQTKNKSTQWSGELSTGAYVYQIRGLDKAGRAGAWSQRNPLVVMPGKPELSSPADKQSLQLVQNQLLLLDWQAQEGVREYQVEVINKKKEVVLNSVVNTNELQTPALPEGVYAWRVRGVLSVGEAYSTLNKKKWKTKASRARVFRVKYREFKKPEIIYPLGDEWPTENGIMQFSWKSVEGAEAYEVRVQKKFNRAKSGGKKNKEKVLIVETTSALVNVGSQGAFKWSVRPLTEVSPQQVDEQLSGQSSHAEFRLLRDYLTEGGANFLKFSALYTKSQYKFEDLDRAFSGSFDSNTLSLGALGEYWMAPNWALSAGIDATIFNVNRETNFRYSADLALLRRLDLGIGWYLTLSLGAQLRQYPALSLKAGSPGEVTIDKLNSYGGNAAMELSKQFTERWSLRGLLKYYYPILSSVELQSGASDNIRNVGLGLQGLYWTSKSFGLAAGLFYENKSLAYKDDNLSQTINMDGVNVFLSAILRLEK